MVYKKIQPTTHWPGLRLFLVFPGMDVNIYFGIYADNRLRLGDVYPSPLTGGGSLFDFKNFLGDDHFQFVGPGQVGVYAILVFSVENLVPVQVHFQPTRIGWGQLDGNVTGVLRAPELGRQPRGDGVVPSRHAVDDFYFNFPELCSRHNAP